MHPIPVGFTAVTVGEVSKDDAWGKDGSKGVFKLIFEVIPVGIGPHNSPLINLG